MKRRTIWLAFWLSLFCLFTGCDDNEESYSGLVVTYGGNPLMFELQGDDEKNYGFVITEDTKLIWEDDSAFKIWEDTKIEYDDWDVFSCSMRVEVIPGEETESADEYIDECVEGWYLAQQVTVTKVEDSYFDVSAKPVIYLYPEEKIDVEVTLDYDGTLFCTYPEYQGGWKVTALPDGILADVDGKTYNYLYWEGITKISYDFSKGYCVAGEDTAEFLENALAKLGLTRKEANEFIVYWLPLMQENSYNIISFQEDVYTEHAKLRIDPAPDTLIRVFMAWKPSEEKIEIEPQQFKTAERVGFTVVEWGGTQVKDY